MPTFVSVSTSDMAAIAGLLRVRVRYACRILAMIVYALSRQGRQARVGTVAVDTVTTVATCGPSAVLSDLRHYRRLGLLACVKGAPCQPWRRRRRQPRGPSSSGRRAPHPCRRASPQRSTARPGPRGLEWRPWQCPPPMTPGTRSCGGLAGRCVSLHGRLRPPRFLCGIEERDVVDVGLGKSRDQCLHHVVLAPAVLVGNRGRRQIFRDPVRRDSASQVSC